MPFSVLTPFRLCSNPTGYLLKHCISLNSLFVFTLLATSCGGSAALADQPRPSVLSPSTATLPANTSDSESSDGSATTEQVLTLENSSSPETTSGEPEAEQQSVDSGNELADAGTEFIENPVVLNRIGNRHCLSAIESGENVPATLHPDSVSIGILAPTSVSAAAQAGLAMNSSANLAREDVEAAGGILGRKVRLVYGDTEGDPQVARQVAEYLITQECVVGLIGVYHSAVGLEIKEVAREYGVPVIFAEPYSDEIVADRYPEVFRIGPSSSMVNRSFARWMKNEGDNNGDGIISATIIAENSTRTINRIETFISAMNEHELRVKPLLVELPESDFSSVIARIVADSNLPDFVFVWFNDASGYQLLHQLDEAAIGPANQTLVVARQTALDDARFWQEVPGGVQTVVSKIGPWHSTATPIGRDFADRYQTIYGFWPESYAFESYDALRLMADAINRAGTADPLPVIEALENASIELASGYYCFPQGNRAVLSSAGDDADAESCGFESDAMWHQWPYAPILFLQYTEAGQRSADMDVIWPQSFQDSISTYLSSD